ncbi:piggyBac transposable element-derived protein 4-like isoform X3 [Ranitomeya imitator]|uniref:piggyBac transposable element-derived protein 4-like isoform X3 n=1 Tax=Ranitomeya imitator TaxID=111125 RepID=UPI0037E973C8
MMPYSMRRHFTQAELEEFINDSDTDEDVPPDNVSEEEDNISEDEDIAENSDSEGESDVETPTTGLTQEINSKNKHVVWKLQPPAPTGRRSSSNVITDTPGPTRYAIARIDDIQSAFLLFINIAMQNILIQMTNIEGKKVYGDKWKNFDVTAMNAYIGLLLLAGVYKSYGESTKSLWNSETGRHIFRATMSLERFHEISRVLRFDKTDRSERRSTDKLAPIRDLWSKWVEILPKCYNTVENFTVDEQLVSFRGRCPFRQYIPSKPAKYGIKIWTLCDSKTSYAANVQVYIGKNPLERPEKNQGMRVVLDLTHGLKGRNVTCDNFFTSYQLGQMLQKNNITMLGTVRKNKPELPQGILNKRDVHSSMFYFTKDTTVVSYVPQKNKQVILMSTMHHDAKISERDDRKPDMILHYNATKGAVDTLDQLVGTYTCKRKTNRWPMILFYYLIDVSAYNAFVLWREINPKWQEKKLHKQRLFIEELGKSLTNPYVKTRPRNESAEKVARQIREHGGDGEPTASTTTDTETASTIATSCKRKRCSFCPTSSNHKSNIMCCKCAKYLCKRHVNYTCDQCK